MASTKSKTKTTTETILVSPSMAEAWLSRQADYQRPISSTAVERYRNLMVRGEWLVTPTQSIGITAEGKVLDGQHRLTALVAANRSIEMSVTFNCSKDTFSVLDRGYRRTLSQISSMSGKRYSNTCHIAALNALNWELSTNRKNAYTPEDCLYLLDVLEPHFAYAFPKDFSGHAQLRISGFRGAALRALIHSFDRREEIGEFVKVAASGLPLPDGRIHTMALMLRNTIQNETRLGRGSSHEGRQIVYRASLIALKHFLAGTQLKKQSSLNQARLNTQPFPIILDRQPRYQSVQSFLETNNDKAGSLKQAQSPTPRLKIAS